jgi:exopolysaccharide biosynthesis polyprenyl glycosylphosphotransferase
VEVDRQGLQAQAQAQAQTSSQSAAAWPVAQARPVMPVLSVEDRLRKRRVRAILATISMFLLDAAMINGAFLGSYYLRYEVLHGVTLGPSGYADFPLHVFLPLQVLVTVGLLFAFYLRGLYRLRPTGTWFKQFSVVIAATTTAFAAFAAYEFVLRSTELVVIQTRLLIAITWGATIVLVALMRLVVGMVLGWMYRRGWGMTNLLVVGSGRLGKLMMQHIAATPHLGFRVVGFVQDMDGPPTDFGRFKVLGTMPDLDHVIRSNRIEEVIIALPSHQHHQILRTVRLCERAGADFKLVPDMYELSLSRIDVDAIEGVPLIGLRRTLTSSWQRAIKRSIDIVIASAVLLIGAPVWLLIALAIKLDSQGPVLYRQERLGYRGEPFHFLKFRSMYMDADQLLERLRGQQGDRGVIFKDRRDPRRTRVGAFLRRTSLDEIPNFINVLRGEMSVVGPRPPLPSEFVNYEDWEKARLEATPGITGLWQVRGRSDIDFDEMVLMDLYYIENWSLRLDLQILLRTIPAVLSRRGAY